MLPKVRRRSYSDIESAFQTRRDSILKVYSGKINIFQETIELSFYLSDILNARFYEDYKKNNKPLDGPKALVPILFDRNNHYLIAAHKLASLFGLINPCYQNLRSVFEVINQIYLLHLTDIEADLFYKKQLDLLTSTEKNELKDRHENLKPAKVRKLLYTGTKKQQADDFYKMISNSTHPSIISAMSDFILRDETIKDALDLTLGLSAANIIAIHETYFEKFEQEEVDEITNMMDKIAKELGDVIVDIIPNNPSIPRQPRIVLNP